MPKVQVINALHNAAVYASGTHAFSGEKMLLPELGLGAPRRQNAGVPLARRTATNCLSYAARQWCQAPVPTSHAPRPYRLEVVVEKEGRGQLLDQARDHHPVTHHQNH